MRTRDDTTHTRILRSTLRQLGRLAKRWGAANRMTALAAIIEVAIRFETFEEFNVVRPWTALGEEPGKES